MGKYTTRGQLQSLLDNLKTPDNNVILLNSGSGNDSNSGVDNWSNAMATLDAAIAKCTANNGDKILIAAGHAEDVEAASGIDIDVAGIEIIGLGSGGDRPKFTFKTDTGAELLIAAASTKISNIIGIAGIDGLTNPINIQAADFDIDIEWRDGSSSVEAARAILGNASADRGKIKLKYIGFPAGNACVNAIRLVGSDNVDIDIDFYGIASTSVIEFHTTACSNIKTKGKVYNSGTTDYTKTVVDTVTGSTWSFDGFDGETGSKCTGSQDEAIAGDDVGAVSTAVSTLDSKVVSVGTQVSTADSKVVSINTALSTSISTADSKVVGNSTAISTADSKIVSINTALSTSISTADSKVVDNSTAISTADSKVVSINTALSTSISTADSKVVDNSTAISTADSKIVDNSTAISTADSKVVSINTALSTSISTADSKVTDNGTAITTNSTAISTADSKVVSINTALSTSISTADSKIVDNSAAISTADSKVVSVNTALSTSISTADSKIVSVNTALSTSISTVDSKITAPDTTIKRLAGKPQIATVNITEAANAGVTTKFTVTTQACMIEKVVLMSNGATTADLTSAAIVGGASQVVEFISAASAAKANIDAEDEQVSGDGAWVLNAADTIAVDLQGSGGTTVDLTLIIKYRAVADGGYLA